MNTPQNESSVEQALRLAQREISMLREQLAAALNDKLTAAEKPPRLTPRPPLRAFTPAPEPPASIEPAAAAPVQPVTPARAGAPHVLCVEDSAANFQLIENILCDRPGTDLVWADSGTRGLSMAAAQTPDLVLLDLDLPDMHGSEVLRRLRQQPATAETPVIVISADATPSQIERMLAAGARDYLTKPFEIRRFLLMFDEVIPPHGGVN